MTQFLAEYGLFLLKTATIVVAIVAIIGSAAAASKKAAHHEGLEVEDLNKKYRNMANVLRQAVMKKADWKKEAKAEKDRAKAEAKSAETKARAFIIDFRVTSRRLPLRRCARGWRLTRARRLVSLRGGF